MLMKKRFELCTIIITLLLALSFAGCSQNKENENPEETNNANVVTADTTIKKYDTKDPDNNPEYGDAIDGKSDITDEADIAESNCSMQPTFESVPSYNGNENSDGIGEDIASQQSNDQNAGIDERFDIYARFDGEAVIENGWIYYRGEGGGIYRMKTDGSNKQLICDDYFAEDITVEDDWVYYISHRHDWRLYRVRTDGSIKQKLCDDSVDGFILDNDWIYYDTSFGTLGLYRMKTDGSDREKILKDWNLDQYVVYDDWLYFGGLSNRIRTDGTDLQCFIDSLSTARDVTMVDDWIYYWREGKICRVKADGTQNQRVIQLTENDPPVDLEGSFIIEDGWIYYLRKLYDEAGYKLCRAKTDGTENQVFIDVVRSGDLFTSNIYGIDWFLKEEDWIYYAVLESINSNFAWSLFRVRTDGSQNQLISGKKLDPTIVKFSFCNGQISDSASAEKIELCCSYTADAPTLDIIGHYTDDWGVPGALTLYPTGGSVSDFCIVSLKMAEEPTDGVYFEVDEVLLNVGTLVPGQGVVAEVCFADMPIRGFAYKDSDGTVHVCSLAKSGEDGSVKLTEDMIRQEY